MDIDLSDDQRAIHENVSQICAQFGDDYWTKCDEEARFPEEYYTLMAQNGWLGITMP